MEKSQSVYSWLAEHAGFPTHRLPAPAELLLCFAVAAANEGAEGVGGAAGGPVVRRDVARDAALRQHELRRARVHFKSDNSAKV